MKKTLWIIATLIFITTIVWAINSCQDNTVKTKKEEDTNSMESICEDKHTPDEILETNELIAIGENYNLIFSENRIIVYSCGEVVDQLELGDAIYAGNSRECYHYFLEGNTVKKVRYTKGQFEVENILNDVKRIIDTKAVYNQDAREELLVETLDGQFKMYIYAKEWIVVK